MAEILGGNVPLELFKRIDGLNLPEVENAKRRKGWIARLWPVPNITERIANLTLGKLNKACTPA